MCLPKIARIANQTQQGFEFLRQQVEKVVNLDENSWTPTIIIIKRSLHTDGQAWTGCWATMSAAVRLVHVHFPLATYVKEILSRSTNTASEMITPVA